MSALTTLVGQEVQQVWVWSSLRLVFDVGRNDESDTSVDVTEFEFDDPAGHAHQLDVEADPMQAGRVLPVLGARVAEATDYEWTLRLAFDNGATLVCRPHPQFEAWSAVLRGEPPIHCPPSE